MIIRPILYRFKDELPLGQVEVNWCYHVAEKCFEQALEITCRQRAKSWELRAAKSLSCLWHTQGRGEEARELLQELRFTEGFDTADLTEAKALLDVLG